jgi:hypothetical protein
MRSSMQSIFNEHFAQYAQGRALSVREQRAASAIMDCGTAAMGAHVLSCPQGHYERIQYHACRHRSCPRCAEPARQQWVQAQLSRLLPCEHFHAVFTLPHEFIALWQYNRVALAKALFDSARHSLQELCADARQLGAQVGIVMALHTWGRTLSRHPHVHCLVSAGGVDPSGQWRSSRSGYLVPVKALSALFRGKLLGRLKELLKLGRLKLPPEQDQRHWRACIARQYRAHWNVQLAQRYAHGRGVALYLARYVKGGPLSRERALYGGPQRVSFGYTDHRDGQAKTLSLAPGQFLARVLWHAPPRGQHLVRHCGLYASSAKEQHRQALRALSPQREPTMPAALASHRPPMATTITVSCPQCKTALVRTLSLLPVHRKGEISNTPHATVHRLGPTLRSSGNPTASNVSALGRCWRPSNSA